MPIDLILGTAGHIDHGKTALVKALTGVDTDRLPEEKKRGITIDLGFAQLQLGDIRLGIVDVPGHERFVRNMLAGATGVDVALLVVAADDSVKPQTREHLEILRLLDLHAGVIALSKCDLPAADWIDLVEAEVRELVADTFLAEAPLVRTSVATGQGLEALRAALAHEAARAAASPRMRRAAAPFRMAIDRSFTVLGHGTVVTGSVASGSARVGDELVIEPGGIAVRVRGLQQHDAATTEVHRGQRAAINLAGVHHQAIERGQELAAAGHLAPSRILTVELALLPQAPQPLRNRAGVRCHVGTADLAATVVLLDRDRLLPGEQATAQLLLREPAATVWGQPLVIRRESPMLTIGGGRVLDPHPPKLRRHDPESAEPLRSLAAEDEYQRAAAAVYFVGLGGWRPAELSRMAGVDHADDVAQRLQQSGDVVELVVSHTRRLLVHRRALAEIFDRVASALAREHNRQPLGLSFDRSRLAHQFEYLGSPAVVEAVLSAMTAADRLLSTALGVSLPGRGPQLSANEQRLLEAIIETYRAAGWQPPSVEEIRAQTQKNQAAVDKLVALAAAAGELVEIAPGFFLHADRERQVRESLAEKLAGGAGLTMSQMREILGVSRKYAVPIGEYLDRVGFTRRTGDVRVLCDGAAVEPQSARQAARD